MTAGKQARIKLELDNLDMALKAYKDKYGAYPPCDLQNSNAAAVKADVARAFPRYGNINNVMTDIAASVDATAFRPDQALVFWLAVLTRIPPSRS